MDHRHDSPPTDTTRSDAPDGFGSRQKRQGARDEDDEDVAAAAGGLPRPAHSPIQAERELGRYGYAGQGYPIYGRRGAPSDEQFDPRGFIGPGSSAYAFGYTTSLHSISPAHVSAQHTPEGHAGQGSRDDVRVDARVLEDVCDRLSDDDELDASNISVSVSLGVVTLDGSVSDRHGKRRAEHIAAGVRGVSGVHNRLRTQKGLWRELGDRIVGESSEEHRGHRGSGTRAAPTLR